MCVCITCVYLEYLLFNLLQLYLIELITVDVFNAFFLLNRLALSIMLSSFFWDVVHYHHDVFNWCILKNDEIHTHTHTTSFSWNTYFFTHLFNILIECFFSLFDQFIHLINWLIYVHFRLFSNSFSSSFFFFCRFHKLDIFEIIISNERNDQFSINQKTNTNNFYNHDWP